MFNTSTPLDINGYLVWGDAANRPDCPSADLGKLGNLVSKGP